MMRFELGLEEPAANRADRFALTIAAVVHRRRHDPVAPLHTKSADNLEALKLSTVITLDSPGHLRSA